jgi:tight adherence protein C
MLFLLPLLAFLFASLMVTAVAMALSPSGVSVIEKRLGEVTESREKIASGKSRDEKLSDLLQRVGAIAPRSTSELGKLQQRLLAAGFRRREAVAMFFGLRLTVAIACFAVAAMGLFGRPNLFLALGFCGFGYIVPGMVLARLAKRRQRLIQNGLPDALDLLVVSVEAGLGLDQAIQRVGEELAFAHPDLADELRLINLELRAGKGRSEALRNLADRTGVEDVSSLVAMLVQTDKFGTSVAQSLRVHSETLRTKRRQRAEEAAAKTGVKMVFPLVFCIFPAIWVVTIGPAALKFVEVIVPMTHK